MAADLSQLQAPPLFVVGAERSGTTLLFEALEAHPEVAGIFETFLFDDRIGLAGLFDDAFWDPGRVALQREHIGRPVGLGQLVTRAELAADLGGLVTAWLARPLGPGHRYLVEKSPVHVFKAPLIAELVPQARFVEIVRDGRDVALSSLAANEGWGRRVRRDPAATGVTESAQAWRANLTAGRAHQRALPDRWLRVRFEDLRADFDGTVAAVLRFAGFPATLEHARAAADPGRHQLGETGFRRGGRVGRWRAQFGLRDALAFHRAAGAMLVEAGYERDRRWVARAAVPKRLRRP